MVLYEMFAGKYAFEGMEDREVTQLILYFKLQKQNSLNAIFDALNFLFLKQIIKIVGAKINWNWLECSYRDDSQHLTKIYYKKLITTFRPDTPSDIIDIFKGCLWPFAEDRVNFTQVTKKYLQI